jgi:uncharacterized membrane protein YfcA
VPILTLINPGFVPVPIQLVAPVITTAALVRERTHLDLSGAVSVMVGRIPGAALGVWLLAIVSARDLSFVIGSAVLFAVIALSTGRDVPLNTATKFTGGLLSGALGTSTGIGGPPIAMLYSRNQGPEVRSTLGAIFTVGLVINIGALAIAGHIDRDALLRAAGLVIPVLLGFFSSGWVKHHFDGERLRVGILIASAFSAIALLVKAASG